VIMYARDSDPGSFDPGSNVTRPLISTGSGDNHTRDSSAETPNSRFWSPKLGPEIRAKL
jgi:hypothetical protein